MYEVEMKFRIDSLHSFEEGTRRFGIQFGPPVKESDVFFQHPVRDFKATDEGLRIRLKSDPDGNEERFITYKGPKIDAQTKTRREIEIPLPEGPWQELLEALGFVEAGHVQKIRRRANYEFQGRQFQILLDSLPALKDDYLELETITDAETMQDARNSLLDLAKHLDLSEAEAVRTSYLALILREKES